MKHFFTILSLFLLVNLGFSQKKSYNTTLMSSVKFNENSSGMWGFTQGGIDYAVIGTLTKTYIYSVEDPLNPTKVFEMPATNSKWREARYFKGFVYVTNEVGNDGLVIADVRDMNNIVYKNFRPILTVGTSVDQELKKIHAINLDENGLLALTGTNLGKSGVLMFDVKLSPYDPIFLGAIDLVYGHDTYSRGDTMYVSEINAGRLGIYNIVDKANPVLMNTQATSKAFTHNAWMSDDKKYIFTTDEREGAWVDAYDITDHQNLVLIDKYQISSNLRSIPHNTYNNHGYLVTSWYTEGIRIIDVHRPENMIEVAGYDTWEDPVTCHSGFHGCWGVYPFAQNNLVFGSDIENGLYIVKVDYKRACYLEGTITDANNKPINNVKIEIVSDQLNGDLTNSFGQFKTGLADAGTYQVIISHPDYGSKIVTVILKNGEITELKETFVPEALAKINANIKNKSNAGIVANISIKNLVKSYEFSTSNDGIFSNPAVMPGTYDIIISSWGYQPIYKLNTVIPVGGTLNINEVLSSGYNDHFETASGWNIVNSSNVVGEWFRGIPRETRFSTGEVAAPGSDSDDTGKNAYVTGKFGTQGSSCDDLDNGDTELQSPVMDLSKYTNPQLNFDAWFFNAGGNTPINDTLIISLFDGLELVQVEKIYGITGEWKRFRNIPIKNFIKLTDSIQLIVHASDLNGSGHIVEAGFDNFSIIEGVSSVVETSLKELTINPNPAQDKITVELGNNSNIGAKAYIYNQMGQLIKLVSLQNDRNIVDISGLMPGAYSIKTAGYTPRRFMKL